MPPFIHNPGVICSRSSFAKIRSETQQMDRLRFNERTVFANQVSNRSLNVLKLESAYGTLETKPKISTIQTFFSPFFVCLGCFLVLFCCFF